MNKDEVAEMSQQYQVEAAEKLVPEGYKLTEVGVIPEDWEVSKFSDLCILVNGRGFKPYEWAVEGLPIIRIQNLNGSEEFNYYSGHYDPKIFIQHGQLLFAWSGSRGTSFGPHIWSGSDALLNYHTWKLLVKEEKVTKSYFFHALKQLTKEIEDSAHGASALVHTQKGEMEQLLVFLPKHQEEQTAIANALSDADALLSELEKLIAKKQAIKTATMQQLLTGRTRLPQFANHPDGSKKGYKQSELGEIPEDWEVVELGELLSYEQPTRYLVDSSEYFENGTVPVLTAGKTFILGYTAELDNLYTNLPVIIFDDFTTASKYVDFPFKAKSSAMKMLRPKNEHLPLALIYSALNSIEFKIGDHKRHWISEFSKLKIKWPRSNEEQTAIATILADMDEEIQALEQRLNKTRQIKQGMMQELLTGKTRLIKSKEARL